MGSYWAYRLAEGLSRCLPRRLAYWLGSRIAELFYRARPSERCAVMRNLTCIYAARGMTLPPAEIARAAREMYRNFGKYLVDFFRASATAGDGLLRDVRIENLDHLDTALKRGKGVIVLSAHFGNWELAGAVLKALGHDLSVVVLPVRSPRLERLLSGYRKDRGFRILPVGGAARRMLRGLAEGGIFAVLADRPLGGPSVRTQFFGVTALLPIGPAEIAHRTDASIVPLFLVRIGGEEYRMQFHPPLTPSLFPDVFALQRAITDVLETEIGAHPQQWFVFTDFASVPS